MAAKETLRRYLMFLAGAMICATGITFVTRAGLGTSPVSSIPFVLSLLTDQKLMGVFTFCFNMLFLVGEAALRRRFTRTQALQIPVTLFFSLCIDWAMAIIPSQYGGPCHWSILYLVIGCCVMALGISLEVMADVIMLPAEAFVRALSQKLRKEFGNVKVCFDSTLTLIAACIALAALHKLNGVGIGTLASALAVGQLVKLYSRLLRHAAARRAGGRAAQ
ncbi:YitT family protein [Intestinimonas sp.]|uniref:YczE/YyaS/YitT family protein n=1 Tax=Intestinimonas sp. TaxID=1965293 RepID=UPI00262B7A7B|nr:DUF6198 family protein [Intestinimonas sp.]